MVGRAKINFDMYSGYVNVSSAPDYLFYWYFSTQDKNPEAPLIIWTNGKFSLYVYNAFEVVILNFTVIFL